MTEIESDCILVDCGQRALYISNRVWNEEPLCAEFFEQRYLDVSTSSEFGDTHLILDFDANGRLSIVWRRAEAKKPLLYSLEFETGIRKLRSFPAPKQGAFNQALGKKSRTVLDLSGGWGGDAMLMASQGYRVSIIERNPLMALLLNSALRDLDKISLPDEFCTPTVKCISAGGYLDQTTHTYDVAYFDPMFPPKRKKSAASSKYMQLLQWLVGSDEDAQSVLETAIQSKAAARVAVKRPDHATPLVENPQQVFSSKLIHYDVYLRG